MALHSTLPIYQVTYQLLMLATEITRHMPRDFKASMGGKVREECLELVVSSTGPTRRPTRCRTWTGCSSACRWRSCSSGSPRTSSSSREAVRARDRAHRRDRQAGGWMAQGFREVACCMTVKAIMPVRINLVVPLAHEATAMRTKGYRRHGRARSCAVAPLIGRGLRRATWIARKDAVRRQRELRLVPELQQRQPEQQPQGQRAPCPRRPQIEATQHHAGPSFRELVAAYFDCRRTSATRRARSPSRSDLERNLVGLFDELAAGTYRPGPIDLLRRHAPQAARGVGRRLPRSRRPPPALQPVGPRFERSFIADSCACIKGRGTLYAARRLERRCAASRPTGSRPAWYLKCDIANFFVAIDKRSWPSCSRRAS
jgi:hypothetical protein